MMSLLLLLSVVLAPSIVNGLDNGLALTPPMGWLHWQRFRCATDCSTYPDDCISEQLFMAMADEMVAGGFLEAGYQYVNIDDCWLSSDRDENDRLQPDPDRFPSGMKALADYIHSKGLKFGIYEDYGTNTCAGYPGSMDYLEIDANTFAEWGVDYLKLDGCNSDSSTIEEGQAEMAQFLMNTGRPIVLSCESPLYHGVDNTNYSAVSAACNLWRNHNDVDDSWSSVQEIVSWHIDNQDKFQPFAGPGQWNDPDMLVIGNFGLSYDESIYQMTVWSIMAAPLIMSVDLRTIEDRFKQILLNSDAIRINQDELGIQGRRVLRVDEVDIWTKPISPIINETYTYAIGFANNARGGYPWLVTITLEELEITNENGFLIHNVFQSDEDTIVSATDSIEVRVNPSGAVLWLATPLE